MAPGAAFPHAMKPGIRVRTRHALSDLDEWAQKGYAWTSFPHILAVLADPAGTENPM